MRNKGQEMLFYYPMAENFVLLKYKFSPNISYVKELEEQSRLFKKWIYLYGIKTWGV